MSSEITKPVFAVVVEQLNDLFVSRIEEFAMAVVVSDGKEPDRARPDGLAAMYFVDEEQLGFMVGWLSHIAERLHASHGTLYAVEAIDANWMPRSMIGGEGKC